MNLLSLGLTLILILIRLLTLISAGVLILMMRGPEGNNILKRRPCTISDRVELGVGVGIRSIRVGVCCDCGRWTLGLCFSGLTLRDGLGG